jgi:hypothetical protein
MRFFPAFNGQAPKASFLSPFLPLRIILATLST